MKIGWLAWVVMLGGTWLIQATRGEIQAGLYLIGMLGFIGYNNLMTEIRETREIITTMLRDRK